MDETKSTTQTRDATARPGPARANLGARALVVATAVLTLLTAAACRRGDANGGETPGGKDPDGAGPRYDGPQPELVVQGGSSHLIMDIEYAPDRAAFATASGDGLVKLWDPALGREIRTYTGASGPMYGVDFSPDGRLVASGGLEKALYIWDVSTGELVKRLAGHSNWITQVRFSPDGSRVATSSYDGTIAVWKLDTGTPQHVLTHPSEVHDLAWSPDGEFIAAVSDRLTLWDAGTGRRQGAIELPDFGLNPGQLTYSPDGGHLAFGLGDSPEPNFVKAADDDGKPTRRDDATRRTIIFETSTWTEVATLPRVWPKGLDPVSGQLMVQRSDDVAFVDMRTGQVVRALSQGGAFAGKDAAFDPNGDFIIATSGDMDFTVHEAKTGRQLREVSSLLGAATGGWIGNAEELMQVAWSPTEPVLALGGFDGHVRLFDLATGTTPKVEDGVDLVKHMRFSPDGKRLLVVGSKVMKIYDTETLLPVMTMEGNGGWASTAFSADGTRLLVGGWDGTVSESDIVEGKLLRHTEPMSPNGSVCRSERAGNVMGVNAPIAGVSYGPGDGIYAVFQHSAALLRFDPDSLEPAGAGCAHNNSINEVAFSPDGKRLAAAGGEHMLAALGGERAWSNNAVTVLDLSNDGKLEQVLEGAQLRTLSVDFDSGGHQVAAGSADAVARVWNADTGALVHELRGHLGEVSAVAFSHDDRYLATASYDLSVKVWDLATGEVVATLVTLGKDGYVVHTPEHHYTASREGFDYVAFRLGQEVVPVELFDVRLNRPDLVLASFGYAPASLVDLYHRAYQKRLRKLGIDPASLTPDYRLPTVRVDRSGIPLSTTQPSVRFEAKLEDAGRELDRLHVFVNDVPVHGMRGMDLAGKGRSATIPVDVALGPGRNKIQVSVLNDRGVESLKETFEVISTRKHPRPDLYVVAIGVSQYQNEAINLQYAAKDARDVAAFARSRDSRYEKVHVLELTDGDARREKILAAREFLANSRVEDEVVLFIAGHGVLDDELDYYFVTHDFDLKAPSKRGLTYEELESVIDGIPARRKLMLVDTCHSGEVDEDAAVAVATLPAGDEPKARAVTEFRALKLNAIESPDASHELLAQLFADLRRGTGAMVISSASGTEYALESEQWNNGVFTYAVLDGLSRSRADADEDGDVQVSELRDYVIEKVRTLTAGQQTPTSRRENLEFDFDVF